MMGADLAHLSKEFGLRRHEAAVHEHRRVAAELHEVIPGGSERRSRVVKGQREAIQGRQGSRHSSCQTPYGEKFASRGVASARRARTCHAGPWACSQGRWACRPVPWACIQGPCRRGQPKVSRGLVRDANLPRHPIISRDLKGSSERPSLRSVV